MFRLCIGALALILVTAGQARANDLLIRNVTIVSPERAESLRHASVLIDDGHIVLVSTSPRRLRADTVIDGGGRFLIPGLIDSHVHIYHATGLRRGLIDAETYDALRNAYLAQLPRSFLY